MQSHSATYAATVTSEALGPREDEARKRGEREKVVGGAIRWGSFVSVAVLVLVLLYLVVPLIATLAFGLSNLSAGGGINFTTISETVSDPSFWQTIELSLVLAVAATILTVAIITPTAYWVHGYLPQARPLMDFLALVPFAVPAIVMAYGLVQVYGTPTLLIDILSLGIVPLLNALNVVNTAPLLVCAYVIVALPFVYRPIDNSLRAINTRVLMEASYSLGSGWLGTFFSIIIPNILPGIISAALLTFSTVMGEFTLATFFNLYTFPVYLNVTGQNDPQRAATLAVLSFLFTLSCVLGIILLIRARPGRGGGSADFDVAATK
jgi:putative spermidine/putrescine transport system permease protein